MRQPAPVSMREIVRGVGPPPESVRMSMFLGEVVLCLSLKPHQ